MSYLSPGLGRAGQGYLWCHRDPASALLYTLLANCRAQGIDAERYLEEALRRMPADATPGKAAELTPAKLAPVVRALQPRPARLDPPQAPAAAA